MKSISKTKKVQFRRSLLASACALAVVTPSAFAQTALFTFSGGTISPASTLTFDIQQVLLDQINDPLTQQSLLSNTNAVQTVPNPVTGNTLQSFTFGNVNSTSFQAVSDAGASNSVGNMANQAQTGSTLTATVTNASTGLQLTAQPPSTNTVTDNTIQAVVRDNTSIVLTGRNPDPNPIYDDTGKLSNYTNGTLGSLSVSQGASITTSTTASIAAVSNQIALDSGVQAGSQASVTGSTINLTTPFTPTDINKDQTVKGNTIAAIYEVNSAKATLAIDAGSTPLNGSVAVGNFQGNLETGGGATTGLTASVSTSSMTTDVRFGPGGSLNVLAGVTDTGNAITASSTGNKGTSSLTLGTGVDVNGPGSTQTNSLNAVAHTADLSADLALLSVQGNSNTGMNSQVDGGTIKFFADNIGATGQVTLSSNRVGSDATGNNATNLIQTGGTSLVGSVAAGNMQVNDDTTLTSTTSNAEISTNVGITQIPSLGKVTLDGNTISAASTGSAASTRVLLDATNGLTLTSTGAGASVNLAGDGVASTTSGTGATASNFQGNYGTSPISSTVSGSNIRADFFNTGANSRTSLSAADITLNGNKITSDATGNTAASTLALGTVDAVSLAPLSGNISGSAAIVNGQLNESPLTATITDSGVRLTALDAVDSKVTASLNKVAATATGNDGNNLLSSTTMDNLTVLSVPLAGAGTASVDTTAQTSTSGAALAIASSQKNTGNIGASNTTTGQFVVVDVSGAASAGVDNSKLTVSGSDVSASGIANNVTNTLQASVPNTLATSDGAAGQVAGIANLQQNINVVTGLQSATLQKTGSGVSIGIINGTGDVTDSQLNVSSNTASASMSGNKATNLLNVATQNYGGTAGTAGVLSSTPATGVNLVNSEFALVNAQTDAIASNGGGRTATVSGINVGVDASTTGDISDSKITLSSNNITGAVQGNGGTNSLLLAGQPTSNLTTSAGLLNNQTTSTIASSTVTAAQVSVTGGTGALNNDPVTLSTNTIRSTAEGNVANNLLGVVATNLTGNSGATGGSSINGNTGLLTVNSDFGLGNVQTSTGGLTASVDGSVGVNFNLGTGAVGGQITLSNNNSVEAIARANNATNTTVLTGTGNTSNITGTASVASYQNGSGNVTASQTTPVTDNATIGIVGSATDGTMLTVTNNMVRTVAEQNSVQNTLAVSGINITGGGFATAASYTPGTGVATTGSDFAVLNVQSGSGTLSATTTPGVIGTRIASLDGGSATISDNIVVAMATVNTASNSLTLSAVNALNATGSVNNVQTSTGGGATATLSNATVGVAVPTGGLTPVTLDGTNTTISGNLLQASTGGNTASNSLTATTVPTITNVGLPTFQVLNYQTNSASMTSLVNNVSLGLPLTVGGSSISNANLTISGNQVLALAYGNNAVNTLTTSSLIGSSSQWLTSTQINSGSLSSMVSNVTLGVTSPVTSSGVTGTFSGNTITAQTVGNSSSNLMTTKK